jgi:hypothetical protein
VFIYTPSPPIALIDLIYFRVFVCRNCYLKFVWFFVGIGLGTHGLDLEGGVGWVVNHVMLVVHQAIAQLQVDMDELKAQRATV